MCCLLDVLQIIIIAIVGLAPVIEGKKNLPETGSKKQPVAESWTDRWARANRSSRKNTVYIATATALKSSHLNWLFGVRQELKTSGNLKAINLKVCPSDCFVLYVMGKLIV